MTQSELGTTGRRYARLGGFLILSLVAFFVTLTLAQIPARLQAGETAASLLVSLQTTHAAMWVAQAATAGGPDSADFRRAAGRLERALQANEAQSEQTPHLRPFVRTLRDWLHQAGSAPATPASSLTTLFLQALRQLDASRGLLRAQTATAELATLQLRSALIALLVVLSLLGFRVLQWRRTPLLATPQGDERQLASALEITLGASDEALLIADPDDRIQHMNTAAEALTGWTADSAQGRHRGEILPPAEGATEDAGQVLDRQGRPLRLTQEDIPLGERGQGRLLRLRRTTPEDNEPALSLDPQTLSGRLIDALPGIFFLLDDQLRLRRWNRHLARLSDHPSQTLAGMPLVALCSEETRPSCLRQLQQALHTGSATGEIRLLARGGGMASFEFSLSRLQTAQGPCLMGIGHDIGERQRAEARIERLAYFDPLTNLPNRRMLINRLEHEIRAARRHAHYGALLFLDLDHFKTINDALGHSHGDALLRQVAERLNGQVRGEDTVARLGGDEFVVILPALDAEPSRASRQAGMAAEKIRRNLASPYDLAGHHYHLSVSIGIGLYAPTAVGVEDILKHADNAMYRAKDEGRNTIRHFEPGMQAAAEARLALETDLRAALENEELQLVYQPQVDAAGEIVGAEALLRWQHPSRGQVATEQFIAVAEESGLILDIGRWVLHQAAAQLQHWCTAGLCREGWCLAVNISPRQFRGEDFVAQVGALLMEYGIEPDRLCLEITEDLAMHEPRNTLTKCRALAALGVRLALDDFGTGRSSLAQLRHLPIDQLKIDQSFVREIGDVERSPAIVETIIAMAGHLGIDIIAEGVETTEELDFLQRRGCHAFQGYYVSPLLRAEQMPAFLARGRISLPMG